MQVLHQPEKGVQRADVHVSLGLTELKLMHAKWILDQYLYFCRQNENILNGFKATRITEVVEAANTMLERIENPWREQ